MTAKFKLLSMITRVKITTVLALSIAVAAVTAVSFFTDRIQQVISLQATEMLGADLQIITPEPPAEEWLRYAEQLSLQTSYYLTFPSVILHQEQTVLTAVKAVSPNYPLRGQLRIADSLYGTETATNDIPSLGTVWLEPRLFTELGLQLGDSLQLGEAHLTVAKVLVYEPDRSGFFLQLAPRVLMNQADVANTQLVTVGSRVSYYFLVAGATEAISHYQQWIKLQPGQSIRTVEEARPELRTALKRAEQFLGLAALIAVILAGTAVALATQHFAKQQADTSAILRCLGATQRLILKIYLGQLLIMGLLASVMGNTIGWIAQQGLSHLLAGYFSIPALPAPSLMPLFVGTATGLVTLLGFGLLPIIRICSVPPLRVLRQDLGTPSPAVWQTLLVASIAMILLIFWQAGDQRLALWMIGGIGVTLLVLMGAAYGLIWTIPRWKIKTAWRFSLMRLARYPRVSSMQLVAFGLSIMLLLLLSTVRLDLLNTWQNNLSVETPNHFIINIQPDKVVSLKTRLELAGIQTNSFYPMSSGRFVAINEKPVLAENYTQDRAKRFAERTFNLSSTAALPKDNRIIAGTFKNASEPAQLSVEEGFAKEMGIQLGDKLTFQVAGQTVIAQVSSLRSVQWDSFNVNFFVLASPEITENLPRTYVTSLYLPPSATAIIPQLVREFAGITIFDLNMMMSQIRQIMDRATLAIEYIFMFTLLAGFVVLYVAMLTHQQERLHEVAILRTLGATRRQLLIGLIIEFATLGLLAGLLASLMASLVGYELSVHLFDLPYHLNPQLWLMGTLGGTVTICLASLNSILSASKYPPLMILCT